MDVTIGQRVCAAIISHQLGIRMDHALKRYVLKCEIHPSWEQLGNVILEAEEAGVLPSSK
jgi:hypothetical protein